MLIKATELKGRLGKPGLKIFDIRGRWGDPPLALRQEYEKGHIPGAVYLDWTQTFLQPGVPIPEAPIADRETARRAFQGLGIHPSDTVMLYDDTAHLFACRVWWSMKYWGFPDVRILDGGWNSWLRHGFEVSTENGASGSGSFEPEADGEWLIETAEVVDTKDQCLVVDGRGEAGFREGRIPGSVNLPFTSLLNPETGEFKKGPELEAVFENLGDWRHTPLISTCGAGYTATVVLFALRLLGRSAPLYDGSFTIWKKLGHPVERG